MDTAARVSFDLCKPLGKISEGHHGAYVVDKYDGVGTAIVALCDGAKSLLARSVPDLKLYANDKDTLLHNT